MTLVFEDGTNITASLIFEEKKETPTSSAVKFQNLRERPTSVVNVVYGTPKPTQTPDRLRLTFDENGDFQSVNAIVYNDSVDYDYNFPFNDQSVDQNQYSNKYDPIGFRQMLSDQPIDDKLKNRKTLLDPTIRYIILNDNVLPASVEKISLLGEKSKICYCDDVCKTLDDCCLDYEAVCPSNY